ncbi:hypothetical protein [uncultured Bifidobacterium sp.]|uniref:hypothetical protein n=1 Tax=uncultured Bifidobacterium sp. TaxID=165187 RepID=UPI0025E0F28C|nr:hypothetical protein [uncultured Bifidobacterium sp.]
MRHARTWHELAHPTSQGDMPMEWRDTTPSSMPNHVHRGHDHPTKVPRFNLGRHLGGVSPACTISRGHHDLNCP